MLHLTAGVMAMVLGLALWPSFTQEHLSGRIIYVKAGGTGDGSSWQNATGDLQAALFAARKGDQVWVAAGRYQTSPDNNRMLSFIIPDGVKLYGGFAGYETSLAQRDWVRNATILSGEIGTESSEDNAYTVVLTRGVSSETVIDGFIIADGTANGTGKFGDPVRSGGGWYNDGTRYPSSPTIRNCVFANNYARDGGAFYNNARGRQASPLFQNCTFVANRVDLDGGAVFNDGRGGGAANPRFENCLFQANSANYGGAMINYGVEGQSNPVMQNCSFVENSVYVAGTAIYNVWLKGEATPEFVECRFQRNQPEAQPPVRNFPDPGRSDAFSSRMDGLRF